jgi:hypothetical protein
LKTGNKAIAFDRITTGDFEMFDGDRRCYLDRQTATSDRPFKNAGLGGITIDIIRVSLNL